LRAFSPRERLLSALEITPEWLSARRLRGVILDLDNTLVPYGSNIQTPELEAWARSLCDAGVRVRLVSNAMPERIKRWSERLGFPGVGAIGRGTAAKPFPAAFLRAARKMDLRPREIAVVGDQLFTDVLGGNLIGAYTILVAPLSQNALPHTRFTRALERAVLHSSDLASKPSRR
jgi:HAD superfamily phosphatase (TIGR01668 family)